MEARKNTRSSYYFSHGTPDEFDRMRRIGKTVWVDLYVDLYRETHPDASLEAIVSDARNRQLRLGRLGIR